MLHSDAAADSVRSQFADDPDFCELLEVFAQAIPERREGMTAAHRTGAYDALQSQAHQMKGAGGGFGFPRLSELSAELEQACKAHDPARIAGALEAVIGFMDRISI